MTQAGWYPDPAGQPQTYRYWDGSAWSQQTSSDPYAPPPASSAPAPPPPPPSRPAPPAGPPSPPAAPPATVVVGGAPPASYGQPAGGYGSAPGAGQPPGFGGFPPAPPSGGSGGSGRSGLTILLVIVAVLALVGLSVGGFFGYRALTDDDDSDTDATDRSSATDSPTDPSETTGPTDSTDPTEVTSPTDTTTTGGTTPTDQQCHGGVPTPTVTPRRNADRVSGGALSIPVPDGYQPEVRISPAFTWADNFTAVYRTIEESTTSDSQWLSVFGVGGLKRSNGFEDPAQAAEVVMACMVASPKQYTNVTGREDVSSGEITVDGNPAYQITSEIRVDNPDLESEGDVAQVIVVDMGDPEMLGLYIAQATIGDQASTDLEEQMVGRILVD